MSRAKSPKEHNLHGNPSRLKMAVQSPKGVGELWAPPAWFDEEQRAEWIHAVEHAPPGLLTLTDVDVLSMWCCSVVEYRRAVRQVRREGQRMTAGNGTIIPNPSIGTMNRLAMVMIRLSDKLGFSPVARSTIGRNGMEVASSGRGPRQISGSRLGLYLEAAPEKTVQ